MSSKSQTYLPSLAVRLTHETLDYKKLMNVYFGSLKINMKKVEIQKENVA